MNKLQYSFVCKRISKLAIPWSMRKGHFERELHYHARSCKILNNHIKKEKETKKHKLLYRLFHVRLLKFEAILFARIS